MLRKLFINHNPTTSNVMTKKRERKKKEKKLVVNIFCIISTRSNPISILRNRCVALDSEEVKKPKNKINPPITLNIPKSVSPKAWRITLEVTRVIPIITIILMYRTIVFFAMVLDLFVVSAAI